MRRWLLIPCLLWLLLVLPTAAGAQVVGPPPTVVTRAATAVDVGTATVRAGVDPNGQPVSYRFEYGTTTGYGYTTIPASAGSGTSMVNVSEDLVGLRPDTVYHYRITAWPDASPADAVVGEDLTFHTIGPPGAATNSTLDVASDSATLSGKVDPNRSPTTFYFEYGPTNAYGQQTPPVAVGQGSSVLYEQARIAGLAANTTYHFRLVATNEAGTSAGQDRGFRTLRAPTGFALPQTALTVRYGRSGTIPGQVLGAGVGGIRLALAWTPFPFAAPFTSTSTVITAGSTGSFRVKTLPVWSATRVHLLTRTTPSVTSADVTVTPSLITTVAPALIDTRRARVAGAIRPRLVGARVALQRLSGAHWVTMQRARTRATTPGHAGYSFVVARGTHAQTYRVVIRPRTQAYAKTITRTFAIAARPKRPHKKH